MGGAEAQAPLEQADAVSGSINFLAYLNDGSDEGYTYANADSVPPGQPPDNSVWEDRHVPITSMRARPLAELGLTGDIHRDGFVLQEQPVSLQPDWTEDRIRSEYYRDVEALLHRVLGADKRVLPFDHTLRRRQVDEATGTKVELQKTLGTPTARQPIFRAHVDYTPLSGPQRVRDLLPDEAEDLLTRRFAIVQVWRPLRGPVLDAPLCMCDAKSVSDSSDLLPMRLIYPDRIGRTFFVKHSDRQRWFYAPRMQPHEAYVFKVYDSLDDGSVARFTPHTAFHDPTAPADSPPRESIEVRSLVFWPKEQAQGQGGAAAAGDASAAV